MLEVKVNNRATTLLEACKMKYKGFTPFLNWEPSINKLTEDEYSILLNALQSNVEYPRLLFTHISKYSAQIVSNPTLLNQLLQLDFDKFSCNYEYTLLKFIATGKDTFIFTGYSKYIKDEVLRILIRLADRNHPCIRWFDYSTLDPKIAKNYLTLMEMGYNDSTDLRTFYVNFEPDIVTWVIKLEQLGVTRDRLLEINKDYDTKQRIRDYAELIEKYDFPIKDYQSLLSKSKVDYLETSILYILSGLSKYMDIELPFNSTDLREILPYEHTDYHNKYMSIHNLNSLRKATVTFPYTRFVAVVLAIQECICKFNLSKSVFDMLDVLMKHHFSITLTKKCLALMCAGVNLQVYTDLKLDVDELYEIITAEYSTLSSAQKKLYTSAINLSKYINLT